MGELQITEGRSLLVSNSGDPATDGIYILQKTLNDNRRFYIKDNISPTVDCGIAWSTGENAWLLYVIGLPFTLANSNDPSANPWESTWDNNMIVNPIILTNNKISIKKQNLGGGKISLYKFLPNLLQGLSLWLKADAGVTTFSYSYKSNITLSLAGESSINGSYTTETPPTNGAGAYIMTGPNNNRIQVQPNGFPKYRLYNLDNFTYPTPWFYSFTSSDGVTWTAVGKKPVSITLSGLTGTSAQSNGTYSAFEWEPGNASFVSGKSVSGGVDTNVIVEIYPDGSAGAFILSPTFFISAQKETGWGIGAWTLDEGTGSPVGTGTLYPTGGVPTGVVTTITVNSDNVTVWADQSGNGRNASAYNDPQLITNQINGKPVIDFDATQYFGSDNQNLNNNSSVFFVVKSRGDHGVLLSTSDYQGLVFALTANPNNSLSIGISNLVQMANDNTNNGNNWMIASTIRSNNLTSIIYKNGTQVATGNYDTSELYPEEALIIGTDADFNEYWNLDGQIAEIIIYNRALTTPERQQVEAYLNAKYAIY